MIPELVITISGIRSWGRIPVRMGSPSLISGGSCLDRDAQRPWTQRRKVEFLKSDHVSF